MKSVLIAYYTRTDSTREIAERLASLLRHDNLRVEALPFSQHVDLSIYDIIVIGAPIHGMHWAKEASTYLHAHQDTLKRKPLALFYSSYLYHLARPFWRRQIAKSLDHYDEFNVLTKGKFGGRITDEFPTFARLLFGVYKHAPMDARDWSEVESWAATLQEKLLLL